MNCRYPRSLFIDVDEVFFDVGFKIRKDRIVRDKVNGTTQGILKFGFEADELDEIHRFAQVNEEIDVTAWPFLSPGVTTKNASLTDAILFENRDYCFSYFIEFIAHKGGLE